MIIQGFQKVSIKGYWRIKLRDSITNNIKVDTGWFPNLITNQGMDYIGLGATNIGFSYVSFGAHCGVGTGSTTPAFTDTQLTSPLAMYPTPSTNIIAPNSSTYVSGSPSYWSVIWDYQFPHGAVVGNVAEIGVGVCTTSPQTTPSLFSHALILDSHGNPTTISVISSDIFEATYELRFFINVNDVSYSMSVSSVTYTGVGRRQQITNPPNFGVGFPTQTLSSTAHEGFVLGPVTGSPTATNSATADSTNMGSYTAGTYTFNVTSTFQINTANFTNGITGFTTQTAHGGYQFSINPFIPKTNVDQLTLVWSITWARYP